MKTTDRKYLAALRKRYARADKKERGQMLDESVRTTGCDRKHAIAVLRGKRRRATGAIHQPRRSQYTADDASTEELAGAEPDFSHRLRRLDGDWSGLAHTQISCVALTGHARERRMRQALEHAAWSGRIEANLEATSREDQILRGCQAQISPGFQQSEGEVLDRTDAFREGLAKQATLSH